MWYVIQIHFFLLLLIRNASSVDELIDIALIDLRVKNDAKEDDWNKKKEIKREYVLDIF